MKNDGHQRPAQRVWRLLMCSALVSIACAAQPSPVSVLTAPGRFDIAAVDASAAHAVAAAAEEGWRLLAAPLNLPEAFPTPVYVRLITAAEGGEPLPFRVMVEPGGVVSVRVFAAGFALPVLRRALVQGLLLRLAVARQGVHERLTAPLWLEHGCVGLWQTRADAAQLDALKQESERFAPPPLRELLSWQRGGEEPRALVVGAMWLATFLQSESGRAREWPALIQRLLGGDEPLAALAASFPDRFGNESERELWWQTGYHQARRARSLPVLDARDSHGQLAALARFIFAGPDTDADLLVGLRDVVARGGDPIVAAELTRRAVELDRLVPALHPFYRNAGLALAEVLRSKLTSAGRREALCAAFERDWRDAVELHTAAIGALDALERG